MAKVKVKKRPKPVQLVLPEVAAYLAEIGSRGGSAGTDLQFRHRSKRAFRAMMHKRYPQDPKWQPHYSKAVLAMLRARYPQNPRWNPEL